MNNPALATWLEQSIERLVPAAGPMGLAICEGILRMASTGRSGLLETVLSGAARNAVAMKQPVGELLTHLYMLKDVIWERLDEEVDPVVAWEMLLTLETIFKTAVTIIVDNYVVVLTESHQSQLAESARVHQDAGEQVFDYAAKLARANRELARLEQAKTDFISIAAHELKTPLSVVVGYVKFLDQHREQILAGEADAVFKGIINGTERLGGIISDLLDISALETETLVLKRSPVAVASLVKTIVQRAEEEAVTRQHQFKMDIAADLPSVLTDGQRIYQVLSQLINNAIKYTPNNGLITICVYLEASTDEVEQDYVKIEVADTGIGIAPEERESVFDKFYRVAETSLHSSGRLKFKGAGPGLGLSIAKGIIEALDGQIWVESPGYDEVNCPGSTFHIRLPLSI